MINWLPISLIIITATILVVFIVSLVNKEPDVVMGSYTALVFVMAFGWFGMGCLVRFNSAQYLIPTKAVVNEYGASLINTYDNTEVLHYNAQSKPLEYIYVKAQGTNVIYLEQYRWVDMYNNTNSTTPSLHFR